MKLPLLVENIDNLITGNYTAVMLIKCGME